MKPEINIMILGQTGTGKSTMINYLYGAEVVKTGTGKPVTGRNDFQRIRVQSPLKPETAITIFDSWGLESDKAEDWKAVINKKLSGSLSFDDMIYAIVYCISYSNDRVQDFEITMVKELLNKDYKIIIVLTNADNSGYADKKKIFRDTLKKKLSEYAGRYSIVDICAEAKPKLGQSGANTATFGKEALFSELEKDVFTNYVKVIYAQWTAWKDESLEKLRDFRRNGNVRIIEFSGTGGVFQGKVEKAREIHAELESGLRCLADDILEKIKNGVTDALDLYDKFNGAFFRLELNNAEKLRKVFGPFLVDIVFPVLLMAFFSRSKSEWQAALSKEFDNSVAEIEKKVLSAYSTAEKLFWELGYAQRS